MIHPGKLQAAHQRSLVVTCGLLIVSALLSVGCVLSPTIACANGSICSSGQVCVETAVDTFCATPAQVAACVDVPDGAECGEPTDFTRCRNGFCQPALCGNEVINSEAGETCEVGVVINEPSCTQRGYDSGVVGCTECTVDTNGCEHYCGDGVADADEECDGEDVNAELALTCAKIVETAPKTGAVVCSRDCRLDVSDCRSLLRSDRIVTLPPIPESASANTAAVVAENDVWVVEVAGSGATAVSYFAHWTGDRWRRAAIETTFQKSGLCDAMWATYGTAFAGCSNGEMITFQGNVGTSNAVGDSGVAITGLWGFAANDVWAAQGQKVLHYNGTSWPEDSDWAALGVATTGTIVAISGDAENLFVLTDTALFHRPRDVTGSWTIAAAQPSPPFRQMNVVDQNHVWLVTDAPPAGLLPPEVKLFTDGQVFAVTLPPGEALESASKVLAGSTSSFYVDGKTLRRFIVTGPAPAPLTITAAMAAKTDVGDGLAAANANSIWIFRANLTVKVRSSLVEGLGGIPPSLTGGRQHIVQGVDGSVYFAVSDTELFVKRSPVKPVETINSSESLPFGMALIDAIAPIEGPGDAELLVLAVNKLRVLNRDANTLTYTTAEKVRGIWADGRRGFVVNDTDLFRYQGIAAAAWTSLGNVHPGTVLMTGGRVNETDFVWIVTGTPAIAGVAMPKLQRFTITGSVASAEDITLPSITTITAVWSSGPDLWIAGSMSGTPTYLARWVNGKWIFYDVPQAVGVLPTISQLWSDQPGQIWVLRRVGQVSLVVTLLHFDGSRLTLLDTDAAEAAQRDSLHVVSRAPSKQLMSLIKVGNTGYRLGQYVNPHPSLTGGACPAQQELFCRESGHGVSEGPRTIGTIVGGRFGDAHYVLNSTLSGRIRFEGQLPAGVEAIWALPDSSGTCPPGAPLAFASSGTSQRAEQTLGPSRYFLTLRPRDPLDKTEYPVALDYSCNRLD